MARIVTIIGTRPEIIKMAPVVKALDRGPYEHVLVHSGQHYDLFMDRVFFKDLNLREPDHRFELREESPPLQVAATMLAAADPERVRAAVQKQLSAARSWSNPFGDGTTSERIASALASFLER